MDKADCYMEITIYCQMMLDSLLLILNVEINGRFVILSFF